MIIKTYCRLDYYINTDMTVSLNAVMLFHCLGYGASAAGYANGGGSKANKPSKESASCFVWNAYLFVRFPHTVVSSNHFRKYLFVRYTIISASGQTMFQLVIITSCLPCFLRWEQVLMFENSKIKIRVALVIGLLPFICLFMFQNVKGRMHMFHFSFVYLKVMEQVATLSLESAMDMELVLFLSI